MRKDVESEGCVLGRFLFDWAIIRKMAGALSAVRGGCINVKYFRAKSVAATSIVVANF